VAQTDPQKEDNLGSNLDEMKIYLTNFDKYKQRAFVNGAEVGVSILGEIKITSPGDYTLRIQSQGQEHFVTRVKLGTEAPLAKVKIPAMQYAVFGYLVNSRECVVGKLSFNLFGEDRTEDIPIKVKGGLAFPIKIGQTGEPVPTEYTVFYQKAGEDIQRKLTFTMKFENDSIDICNAIYKQSE